MLRIKQSINIPLLLTGNNSGIYISRTEEEISKFFVCWWGDTRIWTGEKGFAVPRLTTRPCRPNDPKWMSQFLQITAFYCTYIFTPIFLNSKINKHPLLRFMYLIHSFDIFYSIWNIWFLNRKMWIFSQQTGTINYCPLTLNSWTILLFESHNCVFLMT